MSDRLNELQRQRALLAEHLAWLDREIAAHEGAPPAPGARASSATHAASAPAGAAIPVLSGKPSPIASVTVIPVADAPSPADADALIQRYGYDPKSSSAEVKRGCWTAFAASFVLVALLVLVAWFLFRRA